MEKPGNLVIGEKWEPLKSLTLPLRLRNITVMAKTHLVYMYYQWYEVWERQLVYIYTNYISSLGYTIGINLYQLCNFATLSIDNIFLDNERCLHALSLSL